MPTLTEDQVRTLVGRLREGDEEAARLLLDTYSRRLHALAVNKLAPLGARRRISAEDVVHSVVKSFIRCVNHRPENLVFQVDGDLFGWLAKVTHRKCIRAMSRDFRQGQLLDPMDDELVYLSSLADDAREQTILEDTIDSLLKDLNEPDREIARRLLLDVPMSEVAKELDRTFFAVKSVMDRLRRELTRQLDRDARVDSIT